MQLPAHLVECANNAALVFGKNRWTKYRLMMGGQVGFREGQLVGCEEGNDAT
jgi:hypothetical protein